MENRSHSAPSAADLTQIRLDLKKQIRSNTKVAMLQEQIALRSKKSVVKLKNQKKNVEKLLQNLADEPIEWSSTDEVDSDLISSESDVDSLDEQVKSVAMG